MTVRGDNQLKWLLAKLFFLLSHFISLSPVKGAEPNVIDFCCCAVFWLFCGLFLKRLFHYEFSMRLSSGSFAGASMRMMMIGCRLWCFDIWYVNWAPVRDVAGGSFFISHRDRMSFIGKVKNVVFQFFWLHFWLQCDRRLLSLINWLLWMEIIKMAKLFPLVLLSFS